VISRFHVGDPVPVFFDPNNPYESVVMPGDPGEFLTTMGIFFWFAIPVFVILSNLASHVFGRGTKMPAAGLPCRQHGRKIEVYLPDAQKKTFLLLAAWSGLGFFGIVAGFLGPQDNWKASVAIVTGGTLLAIIFFLAWRVWRQATDVDMLIIDANARTLILPATFGRKSPMAMNFDSIDSIRTETMDTHTKIGGIRFCWVQVCYMQGNELREAKIAVWLEQETRADVFANWLLEYLNCREKSGRR
jgi:hypothetical protein